MTAWEIRGEGNMPKESNPIGNTFYGYRDTYILLPDGRKATYFGIVVRPCVLIVSIEDDLTTYFVRQKRPNARQVDQSDIPEFLELPGGLADSKDLAYEANRELRDETGISSSNITEIGVIYPYPSVSNERDHIFLGRDLLHNLDGINREATEQDIEVISAPFAKIYDQVRRGQVMASGPTIAALTIASTHL